MPHCWYEVRALGKSHAKMAKFNPYALNVPMPWDEAPAPAVETAPKSPQERMLIYPPNHVRRNVFDELHYETWPYPPEFEPQAAGLQGLGETQQLDLLTMLDDVRDSFTNIKPTIDFLGSHPMLTLTLLMTAIIAGGAVGGYIGAGYKTGKR